MGIILSIVLLFAVLLVVLLFSFKDDILQSKYLENFKNNDKYLTQPDLHNLIIFLEKKYNTHIVLPHKIKYTKENNQYHIHDININNESIDIIFTPNKNVVTSLFLFNTFGTYHYIDHNNDNHNNDNNNNDNIDINIDSIIDNADDEIMSNASINNDYVNNDYVNNDYINITSEDNIEPDSDINTTESIINLFS
jgi:hypothetical protein